MSDILLEQQSAPVTPSTGQAIIFIDANGKKHFTKDSDGVLTGRIDNGAVTNQAGFATDTYVTNSDILIPTFGLQAKTMFRWRFSVSKTAAGTATPIYTIRTGAARTTSDTSRLVLTGVAQTAAADVAVIEILLTVRSIGASGVIQGTISMIHNLAATGFANNASSIVEATSAGFDTSVLPGQYIGVSINGGTSAVWTMTQARAEAIW